jgi:hypothetical protein
MDTVTSEPQPSAATQRFDAAFAALTHALQEALAASGQQERVNAAYLEYAQLLKAALAGQDVQPQATQAYARYIGMLNKALSPAPHLQRALEAFRDYARAVRDAWASLDPDDLNPAAAAAIAQTIVVASSTVAGIAHESGAPAGDI